MELQTSREAYGAREEYGTNGRASERSSAAPSAAMTIGLFGSYALVVNNISGPGLLDFPHAFQEAGWLPCVLCISVVAVASAAVASSLADAHAALRQATGEDMEFADLFGEVFGPRVFRGTQFLYFLNLFSQNVAAIVSTAQATDSLAAMLWGRSWALFVPLGLEPPRVFAWEGCDDARSQRPGAAGCAPFGDGRDLVLSAGYAFCALTLAPLGFATLTENMLAQKISFAVLVLLVLQFLAFFATRAGEGAVPAVGARAGDVLGVALFNFAFCVTVPSWLNEKRKDVNGKGIIWGACVSSAALYCAVGWLGGLAFKRASDNVLDELAASGDASVRAGTGLFAYAILGLGVPVFCVLMRYNLVAGGMPLAWAHFCGGALPWLVSWLVYRGHGVLRVLTWSGLVLNASIDFVAPMVLAAKLAETRRERLKARALLVLVSVGAVVGFALKVQDAVENGG
eukprot:CAMPEP_0119285398 /NCGR_PEP_ID=MMETSP1329-20130426/32103_1 /TAXON_ID=114041 /ORGANISM="Genus nov. species nov., Strain RCC1024" /LENGTH=455 /DNA_ID=CAMNT_0007286109 /DNA_START=119 /DNA_END=1483 /DNA_ORIENTATION=-